MITVAHRVPATESARAQWATAGADRYEADVQLARDGSIVVSHFLPFLGLRGLPFLGLRDWLQHDGRTFRWGSGHDPSLPDAVRSLPAGAGVLLDPKETDRARRAALVDALVATLADRGRFVVSTDHPDDLDRYRAAGFETWRTVKNAAALHDLLDADALPDAGVSVRHTLLDPGTVGRLHERVRLVVAWTVNDEDRARELLGSGVDGITTDRPAIARVVRRLD